MPWLRNSEAPIPYELQELFYQASNTVRSETYRSRNPIDTDLFTYLAMPFRLSMVPANLQNTRNKFKTVAMPRGVTPEEAYGTIHSYVAQAFLSYGESRHILIVNIDSNQAVTPHVMQQLTEQHWVDHDYRTALTCTPFHQVYVMTCAEGRTIPHTIIFTSVVNDEFITKLGAVLPLLYGYTMAEDMSNAYLNCDKAAFMAAFMVQMADIIAARRQAEQDAQLTQLEAYLKTTDTNRIDNEINSKQRDIAQREASLRSSYAALNDLLMRKASVFWGEADNRITEFIQYIRDFDRDKITAMNFNAGNDQFSVQLVTELAFWDEDAFRSYATAGRGNCVTNRDAATKALLTNIFIDRTVKVIIHTAIRLFLKQGFVQNYNDYLRENDSVIGIPHTHIYHHDCWGNNRGPIEKAFAERNYLIAWEQIKATLCGLNIPDATVFSKFCERYMAGSDTPCLVLKGTNEKLSPNQFRRKYPKGWNPATATVTPETTASETVTVETPRPRARRPQPEPVEHDVIRPAIDPDVDEDTPF